MRYFIFGSRTLQKRLIKRLQALKDCGYKKEDSALFNTLKQQSPTAASQTKMLVNIAETHPFTDTKQKYYPLGEDMHQDMLEDLRRAKKFIYMEYFIVEEEKFWNSILEVLKEKAASRVMNPTSISREFISAHLANQYNAMKAALLNRPDSEIDKTVIPFSISFSRLICKKTFSGGL